MPKVFNPRRKVTATNYPRPRSGHSMVFGRTTRYTRNPLTALRVLYSNGSASWHISTETVKNWKYCKNDPAIILSPCWQYDDQGSRFIKMTQAKSVQAMIAYDKATGNECYFLGYVKDTE